MSVAEQFTIPSRKSEAWRYFPVAFFKKQSLSPVPDTVVGQVDAGSQPLQQAQDSQASSVFIFQDGQLTNTVNIDGLTISKTSLEANSETYHEDNPLISLNQVQTKETITFTIEKSLDQPIRLDFQVSDGQSGVSSANLVFNVTKDAKCEIYTRHLGDNNQILENNVFTYHLEAKSFCDVLSVKTGKRPMSDSSVFHLASESVLNASYISPYTTLTRHDAEVYLRGERANAYLNGLSILKSDQHFAFKTRVHHMVPECESYQHFKNILTAESTSEYNGLVEVYKDAQLTDSYQLNRNLILSESAKAFSRPQLRIFADDVKCSHGSTTGQIQESEILYLMSRGLTRTQAHAILVFGFADEVLESAKCEFAHDDVRQLLRESLERLEEN